MLTLSKLLVQTPKDLYDTESGRCDRVGKVTTWWTDGTDDTDTTLAIWGSKSSNLTGTLVERGELGSEVSWETLVCTAIY